MTIAQGAIVAKLVQLLGAAPALASIPVYRNRLRPLSDTRARAVVVRKSGSDPAGAPLLGQGVDYLTQIRVECYARGSDAQAADEACDELLQLAHAVVVANPTLDGLCMAIDPPRLGWDEDDLDSTIGAAIAQYQVLHRADPSTLAAAA